MSVPEEIVDCLVIGYGGREAAIIRKLRQSKRIGLIYAAPGNAGLAKLPGVRIATFEGKPIEANDTEKLIAFAKTNRIGLTVVGPEGPLCNGIVDAFREAGLPIFGPTQAAAQLEGSKLFTKNLLMECGVPTAAFKQFSSYAAACRHVRQHFKKHPGAKIVVKADGLAGGKGVIICAALAEALAALALLMKQKAFAGAGTTVVIEEFLEGHELSFMAFYDGKDVRAMIPSQDHKQVGEPDGESTTAGDVGPMTGGMGAFARVGWATNEMISSFVNRHILPMLQKLETEYGIVYTGCLYIALMYTADGFKVLEWNARPGDPETQAVLALMQSDLLEYLLACTNGTLGGLPEFEWHDKDAVCIALCEAPYPETPKGGKVITGTTQAEQIDGAFILYAGVSANEAGELKTAGGRVLYVVCVADTLDAAWKRANKAAELIKFEGVFFRHDISQRKQPIIP